MSDDMLSQDEIDALLKGTGDDEGDHKEPDDSSIGNIEEYLDAFEQDTLGEIGNISFGSSATALSSLLSQKVEITTPTVSIVDKNKLKDEFPHPYAAIEVEYTEGFSGVNLLVIKQSDAAIIADLMLGGDGTDPNPDLGEIQLSAVQEAMNQMMGSAATSMSTIFNKKVDISPPAVALIDLLQGEGKETIEEQDLLVKISFRLAVGELIDSNIMQLLPLPFAKSLVHELMNPGSAEPEPSQSQPAAEPSVSAQATQPNYEQPPAAQPQPPAAEIPSANAYQQPTAYVQQPQQSAQPQHFGSGAPMQPQQPVQVQSASFASFEQAPLQEHSTRNLNMLLDIPLQVTVELGRTNRSVKDILDLSSGSIIELDKLAGEPVDILVNNRLIATGEVVVIEENFGVRITEISSKSDRLKKLN
ncbi:flagellar motor switch protein FliN/FliY [Bacillus ectoiniformans]|nr:flagellar motor switch protein FliN/FliY [Bacillus ectoiniformans]